MAKKQPEPPTLAQKLTFLIAILVTMPLSLIYLAFWRGRCVHCGKRIFFNKKVCKKCTVNSHAIVDEFDEKIEMFFQQMAIVEDITDIISQFSYVIDQLDGIQDIYDTLDEEVDVNSMEQKTVITLERTLEPWMDRHIDSFKNNLAYKNEIIEEIEDLQEEYPYFKDLLQPYLDEIKELESTPLKTTSTQKMILDGEQ